VELLDPVPGVRDEEVPNRPGAGAIEVDGRSPLGPLRGAEVVGCEVTQVVPVGAQVVVDDVKYHPQADGVGPIHERPEIVGTAVEPSGGEEVNAVITPAEIPCEVGDRQHLHDRDAQST
jgi:hypothetical protein